MAEGVRQHPVQLTGLGNYSGKIPEVVALRAYEVYAKKYGPQEALIDLEGRGCRGGFGVEELIAFLYARSFPKEEWSARVDEAFNGMDLRARR